MHDKPLIQLAIILTNHKYYCQTKFIHSLLNPEYKEVCNDDANHLYPSQFYLSVCTPCLANVLKKYPQWTDEEIARFEAEADLYNQQIDLMDSSLDP